MKYTDNFWEWKLKSLLKRYALKIWKALLKVDLKNFKYDTIFFSGQNGKTKVIDLSAANDWLKAVWSEIRNDYEEEYAFSGDEARLNLKCFLR